MVPIFKRVRADGQLSAREINRAFSTIELQDRMTGGPGVSIERNGAGFNITQQSPVRIIAKILAGEQPYAFVQMMEDVDNPGDWVEHSDGVTTAGSTITDATNATPIVITSADHGVTAGGRVSIRGVAGGAAANGDWPITVLDTNTFELDGSVGSGAYTSGGWWIKGAPAYEMSGRRDVHAGDLVEMWLSPVGDRWYFRYGQHDGFWARIEAGNNPYQWTEMMPDAAGGGTFVETPGGRESELDSGTATAGASTTLTDSSQSWSTNQWAGRLVHITAGTGADQVRLIASNTSTVLTVTAAWSTNPSTDSDYSITDAPAYEENDAGNIPNDTIVWMRKGAGLAGGVIQEFSFTGPVGGSIQVEDADETPSVSSVNQLRFDSTDGFSVSTPGAGVAVVDMLPASRTQAGNVVASSIGPQSFGGAKNILLAGVTSALALGNSQATAIQHNRHFYRVDGIVAGSDDGVMLDQDINPHIIKNSHATDTLKVYPPPGGSNVIEGLGATLPLSVLPGQTFLFVGMGTGQYWVAYSLPEKQSTYTQTYSTGSTTVNAYTTDAESAAYTGIDNAQGGTPYAQLTDLNALRTAYENLRASHDNLLQVVTQIIDDLQANALAG